MPCDHPSEGLGEVVGIEMQRCSSDDLPFPVITNQYEGTLSASQSSTFDDLCDGFSMSLFDHQKRLVKRCLEVESGEIDSITIASGHGVIGDGVGHGKSYSVILLGLMPIDHVVSSLLVSSSSFSVSVPMSQVPSLQTNTNLLVVPHGLMCQWIKYFADTRASVCVVDSSARVSTFLEDSLLMSGMDSVDFLLVSSTMYKRVVGILKGIHVAEPLRSKPLKFKRLFIDEADSIQMKDRGAPAPEACFTWLVTATFSSLVTASRCRDGRIFPFSSYQYKDFGLPVSRTCFYAKWCFDMQIQSQFLHSRCSRKLIVKNCEQCVLESLAIPEPIMYSLECRSTVSRVLRGIVRPEALELIQAGDMGGAIRLLNVQAVADQQGVISAVTSRMFARAEALEARRALLEAEVRDREARLDTTSRLEVDWLRSIKNSLACVATDVEDARRRIDLLSTRIRESNVCPITMGVIETPSVLKCCNNVFEFSALTEFIASKEASGELAGCPFCRKIIIKSEILVQAILPAPAVVDKLPSGDVWQSSSHTRMENLLELLAYKQHSIPGVPQDVFDRVLIFSSSDNIIGRCRELESSRFTPEEDEEAGRGVATCRVRQLVGRSTVIDKNLKWFGDSSVDSSHRKVLLLNAYNFGSGLNIQSASCIIVLNSLRYDILDQVVGRAQRLGRTEPLHVISLVDSE